MNGFECSLFSYFALFTHVSYRPLTVKRVVRYLWHSYFAFKWKIEFHKFFHKSAIRVEIHEKTFVGRVKMVWVMSEVFAIRKIAFFFTLYWKLDFSIFCFLAYSRLLIHILGKLLVWDIIWIAYKNLIIERDNHHFLESESFSLFEKPTISILMIKQRIQ